MIYRIDFVHIMMIGWIYFHHLRESVPPPLSLSLHSFDILSENNVTESSRLKYGG
jgi:hypothetical protein